MPRQTSLTGLLRSGAGPLQSPGGGARADPVQADGPGVTAQARAGNMALELQMKALRRFAKISQSQKRSLLASSPG